MLSGGVKVRRSISIVIPAYNEERRLGSTLHAVERYLASGAWNFGEVVVVDDGSSDSTAELAEETGVRVLRNVTNRGKGYSVRRGVLEARGDWVLFSDADLSAPIEELETLWSAAMSHGAQCVIGSRAVDPSLIAVRQSRFRERTGRLFNYLMRLQTGMPFKDTQCGFKLFEGSVAREIFGRQRLDGFGFDVEILFIAARLGYQTIEVPVRWSNSVGTKVNVWSGAKSFADPLRVRWNGFRGKYPLLKKPQPLADEGVTQHI